MNTTEPRPMNMWMTGDVYIDSLAFTRMVARLDPQAPWMDATLAKLVVLAQTVLSKPETGFTP